MDLTGRYSIVPSVLRHLRGQLRLYSLFSGMHVVGPTTPWFPGGLLTELEETMGRRVDVVVVRSLNPLIRESVLMEALPL